MREDITVGICLHSDHWNYPCWSGRTVETHNIDQTSKLGILWAGYVDRRNLLEKGSLYSKFPEKAQEVLYEHAKTGRWPWEK